MDINSSSKHAEWIQQLQTEILFSNSKIVVFGQLVIGGMVFFYLQDSMPSKVLDSWFIMLLLLVCFRVLLNTYFQKHRWKLADQSWRWIYTIISLLSGLTWGYLGLLPLSDQQFYLIVLVLGGLSTSAMMTSAVYPPATLLFVPAVSLPFIIVTFTREEGSYQAVGWFALVYFSFLLVFLRTTHKTLMEGIELRFENRQLIQQLTHEKEIAQNATLQAENENAAKSKFLAAASHDLRQPLHALGLFFDALKLSPALKERETIFPNIDYSIKSLGSLLDALLDISKLDANAIEYRILPTDIGNVIQNMVSECQPEAGKKGIQLKVRVCRHMVETDPVWLERILRNLITNAIRYTQSGRVLVSCRKRQDKVILQVWDTGPGIPAEELDNIFIEFRQLENPERERNKGLGLGLAIIKRLCKLLGHSIDVKSTPGKGSVFSVSMPVSHQKLTKDTPQPTRATDNLKGKNILVIDDEISINQAMCMLLGKWGCRTKTARSVDIALKEINQGNYIPDVIISDYRLENNKTGVDAIHTLHDYLQQTIPALLITGDTSPERINEIKTSGYKVLHKPVNPAKLRIMLNALC